jgi:hypothetical protein
MSEGPSAAGAARRVGSGTTRVARAWRALPHESRLAAFASAALFLALFLPWYQVTLIARSKSATLQSASATITGWGAFSFVEAVVLLVAAGVVTLLFHRAEGRAFHLPGGDGAVISAAGLSTCLLIVWGMFDKPGASARGPAATTSGIEWGIFVALAAAAFLAYSGSRIRAAHRPEPPRPGSDGPPVGSSPAATTVVIRRREPAPDRPGRPITAAELFERVIPDDPPTMPFGRAKRSDVDVTIRMATPPPADEQPTIPLGEDATVPLGEDATVPVGEDETLPLDR